MEKKRRQRTARPDSTPENGDADRLFGAHMSIAGGHENAVRSAAEFGFKTVQLFTKSNSQWRAAPLTDAGIQSFRAALKETGVRHPVAHNSYLINLASPSDALWNQSVDAMTVEVERAEALGIVDLVAHPGAHVGSGEDEGLRRIAVALDEIHRRTRGVAVRINLETTAGQGTCLGHDFAHLKRILELVREPERLGVCADSCHVFAAGYALEPAEQYDKTIGALIKAVGKSRLRVWHLNDSVKPLGSRVDRHAAIGQGCLGLAPFRAIVTDARFRRLPMILETPKGMRDGEHLDAINLRTLRRLARPARTRTRTRTN